MVDDVMVQGARTLGVDSGRSCRHRRGTDRSNGGIWPLSQQWSSLNPLRYSAAILAAAAWMSAATYTAHRLEPSLAWVSAALAALAGLGLVIADAAIRPRARRVGLVGTTPWGFSGCHCLWAPPHRMALRF